MKFKLESQYCVTHDESASKTVIRTDNDGFDVVEICYISDAGEEIQSMTFAPDEAILVAEAMIKKSNELKQQINY